MNQDELNDLISKMGQENNLDIIDYLDAIANIKVHPNFFNRKLMKTILDRNYELSKFKPKSIKKLKNKNKNKKSIKKIKNKKSVKKSKHKKLTKK